MLIFLFMEDGLRRGLAMAVGPPDESELRLQPLRFCASAARPSPNTEPVVCLI